MDAKNLGTKNNHEYFSKFMINAFYGKKPIQCLNAGSGQIALASSSDTFNTQLGWYYDKNEKILNEDAQQFQQLSIRINKMARSGNRDFNCLKLNQEVVYRFLHIKYFVIQLMLKTSLKNWLLGINHLFRKRVCARLPEWGYRSRINNVYSYRWVRRNVCNCD